MEIHVNICTSVICDIYIFNCKWVDTRWQQYSYIYTQTSTKSIFKKRCPLTGFMNALKKFGCHRVGKIFERTEQALRKDSHAVCSHLTAMCIMQSKCLVVGQFLIQIVMLSESSFERSSGTPPRLDKRGALPIISSEVNPGMFQNIAFCR
jgi:hypothetical protein